MANVIEVGVANVANINLQKRSDDTVQVRASCVDPASGRYVRHSRRAAGMAGTAGARQGGARLSVGARTQVEG